MSNLEKMTKSQLVELAAAGGLVLDGSLSKARMVRNITESGIELNDAPEGISPDDTGDANPGDLEFNTDPAAMALARAAYPDATFENDIQVKRCLEVLTPTARAQAQQKLKVYK